jgi:protein tyrosine/serine phosphatase
VTGSAPQWLDLDGVVNMRDVGGLPTTDGGRIASGRLIRSDNLQDLTPASVRRLLDDLHVTDVVDLRTSVEVAKEGEGPLVREASVRIHELSLYTEDTRESGIPAGERELPWARDRQVGDREPTTTRDEPTAAPDHDAYWAGHYWGYLQQRPDSVVAALRIIATSEGATLVHCAAGKDRTGTIVGLALLLAGAEPEAVAADFAASSERVPQIMERLARRPAYAANLVGKSVDQQTPRPDTMRRLVAALGSVGGLEAWLAGHGWTPEETQALRRRLLAP